MDIDDEYEFRLEVLSQRIKEQGAKIRELKLSGADRAIVQAEISILISFKNQLEEIELKRCTFIKK